MRNVLDSLLILSFPTVVERLSDFMAISQGRDTLPELAALAPDAAVTVGRLHKDNLTHSILVCGQTPPRLRLRWAALLHDVGKARTRVVDADNHVSFHGHEDVGARLAYRRLKALGYDETFCEEVATLVAESGHIASFSGEWTDAAVRRIARALGPLLDDALDLVRADCTSKHERNRIAARARADGFKAAFDDVSARDAEAAKRPPIDGIRVMEILGLQPGRDVGIAMKWMMENCFGIDSVEAEVRLVAWWKEGGR